MNVYNILWMRIVMKLTAEGGDGLLLNHVNRDFYTHYDIVLGRSPKVRERHLQNGILSRQLLWIFMKAFTSAG